MINEDALEAARLAVENELIEMRDARISWITGFAHGFVVREQDGSLNGIMRLGTKPGLRIAIEAYLAALETEDDA